MPIREGGSVRELYYQGMRKITILLLNLLVIY